MADTITLNAGAGGAVLNTDDIGGTHTQIVKVGYGPLDTLTLADTGAGLPVADGGGSLTVDNATISVVGGGVEATAQRVTIASDSTGVLSVDDNGSSLTVDNAQLSVVSGGTEATAMRVTIANDSTGVLSVDDNGGALTVDNGGTFAVQSTPQATEIFLGYVGINRVFITTEKTRPADTTAYAANDAICESASAGTVWTFTSIARIPGGTFKLSMANIASNVAAETERLELDLYSEAPTAINDNAEATQLYANFALYLGTLSFPALAKKTANSNMAVASIEQLDWDIRVTGSSNLIGILRTLDAFTPVSGAKYSITLFVTQE